MNNQAGINLSAMAASTAIRNRDISAVELAHEFLDAIASGNPRICAVRTTLTSEALKQAESVDQRLADGANLGPLAGIPIVVKENCDVAGVACSAGLSFRQSHIPSEDSAVTSLLRKADATIIGISVSDPGAFTTRTREVTHPIDERLTAGGSSGGSGAGLLSGMCLGAIGTDTGGSIRIPAACCGTVGLKPTFGSVPMDGIFPLVPSLDHVGPMARNVPDTELMWNALQDGKLHNVTKLPKRVGFDASWISEADEDVAEAVSLALELFEQGGIELVEIGLPDLDEIASVHSTIFVVEALKYHVSNHNKFRDQYPDIARDWFDYAEGITQTEYENAVAKRRSFAKSLNEHFGHLDIIASPTLPKREVDKHASTLNVAGQELDFTMAMVRMTSLFDHTGHPALAMPIGTGKTTIPASLQLVGPKNAEAALFGFGKWVEKSVE